MMDRPLQTKLAPSRHVDDQFATSVSALQNSSHNRSMDRISGDDSIGNHTQSGAPEALGSSNSAHQLSDMSPVDQELSTHGSWHSRRMLPISTIVGRHTLQRKRGVALRLLTAFLAVSLGVYLAKYLSRCVLSIRRAGRSSDATRPGLQYEETRFRVSGPLASVTGNGRRLAAAEWGGGSGKSPETTESSGESKDPICEYSEVNVVDNTPPEKIVPPVSVSEEALLLRDVAKHVMAAAAAASSALSKCQQSGDELRGVLQSLTQLYGKVVDQAEKVEKRNGKQETDGTSMRVERSSESGSGTTTAARTTADHIPHTQTEERGGETTSSMLSKDPQFPPPSRPTLSGMRTWSGNQFSLETIFETEESESRIAKHFDSSWLQPFPEAFGMDKHSDKDTGEDASSLAEALKVVELADDTQGNWHPFSSGSNINQLWEKILIDPLAATGPAGDDANDVTGGQPRRPSYSEVLQHPPARSHSAPPRSTAANGKGMAKRVAGLGQRLTSSGHRQSATSRDASGERRHYPSGPRVPGRRPTNRFESIDRSASHRRAGARPSLPSMPPPKPPLPQISKVGFGASGTPVQRGASQGGTPSGSEKRDGGEPSKDVKGQGEDAGQPGASGGPLGGAGGGGRRPGDDERDDDKRKKGKGSSSGGGEKKKEEQEKKAKKERDQREEAKKQSKPMDGREARGKEVTQGDGGLSSVSGKGSTGEGAGKKKAKKDRGRRAIEETVRDVTDAVVTSEATGGVPKEAEPQKDGEDRGVHGGGRGGEGPGSAGATETDGVVHPEGGDDGSSPEGGDPSQCQKTGSDKGGSKQQMTSSEKRKKRGASGRQSRQTTTGAGQQPGGFSETRTDTTVASGTETMATDRRVEDGDSKADDDGQGALQGPPAGAEKDGGEDAESEEAGGKDAAGAGEADDESAAKEALRTGARPKTSSAISKRKQKKRPQRTELPVQSEPPSTGSEEEATTQTRGRARQRTLRDARRGGPVSGHEASKGIVGSADSRRGAAGQSSDRVSGKGSKASGAKSSASVPVDFDELAANLKRKLLTVIANYEHRQKELHHSPGAKAFLDVALTGELTKYHVDPGLFPILSKAVLIEAEQYYTLKLLFEVATGLHERETKLKEERAHETHAPSAATAKEDDAGATGSEDSPLTAVIDDISVAIACCNERRMSLLVSEKWFRSFHIATTILPELPEISLPILPGEKGDKHDTDEEETSEELPDTSEDPLEAVLIVKKTLEQWESRIPHLITSVEALWWRPPRDPDEAIRQRERTAAMFKAVSGAIVRRFLRLALQQWNVEEGIRHSTDPSAKEKLQLARELLASYIAEKEAQEWEGSSIFAASILATAKANVRNPSTRWDPLPSNDHAPDVRAAAHRYRQMSS
uniref:Toxoplasma gondii family E protein n=2 Tax=Toxoplasma gondii (strain ATCC 50861 / VEG) TaxID=432359 RepID=A0A0F7UT86_TOXGV|nr:TPA: Toxoplasma gondii family E protein [Toxoplasma gondii VEG]